LADDTTIDHNLLNAVTVRGLKTRPVSKLYTETVLGLCASYGVVVSDIPFSAGPLQYRALDNLPDEVPKTEDDVTNRVEYEKWWANVSYSQLDLDCEFDVLQYISTFSPLRARPAYLFATGESNLRVIGYSQYPEFRPTIYYKAEAPLQASCMRAFLDCSLWAWGENPRVHREVTG